MALDPKKRSSYSAKDREFLRIVEEHGWHVTYVAPREGTKDKREWWGYSTGIFYRFQQPEIVLFGLPYNTTVVLINAVGDAIKSGRKIEPEREEADFLRGYNVIFKAVHASRYADYLGFASWFYEGQPFPALQMLFPDKKGKFPWEKGCDPKVKQSQPLLYTAQKVKRIR